MGDVVVEICKWDQRKMCFNKQQVKDAVTYFSLIVTSPLVLRFSARLLAYLYGPFLPTYSYIFMKVCG